MKRCRVCDDEKPLDEFYRNPSHADGRMNTCKLCHCAHTGRNKEIRKLHRLRRRARRLAEAA